MDKGGIYREYCGGTVDFRQIPTEAQAGFVIQFDDLAFLPEGKVFLNIDIGAGVNGDRLIIPDHTVVGAYGHSHDPGEDTPFLQNLGLVFGP